MPKVLGNSKTARPTPRSIPDREPAWPRELERAGRHLRTARVSRGWTLRSMAAKSGVNIAELSKIEGGHRLPTLLQSVALARALGLPLQWLTSGAVQPADSLEDIALELRHLGVVDLHVPDARVPGSFRTVEELLTVILRPDRPLARLIEALPAVLAWNDWHPRVLQGFATAGSGRALQRVAWLADVALTIDQREGFPGGCRSRDQLETLRNQTTPTAVRDDLGASREGFALPPVSKRWNIAYPASLQTFRDRATHLVDLRQTMKSPRDPAPR